MKFHRHKEYCWLRLGPLKLALFHPGYRFINPEPVFRLESFKGWTLKVFFQWSRHASRVFEW